MDSDNQKQKQWMYSLLFGAMSILIGVLLIIFKRDSLNVILIISGVLLAVNGVLIILGSLSEKTIIGLVLGGVLLALGIALIILPALFADIFMILLAILLIIIGVSGVVKTFDASDSPMFSRIIALVIAVAMTAVGILVLFNLQKAEDWLMIAVGITMIASGIMNVLSGVLESQLQR